MALILSTGIVFFIIFLFIHVIIWRKVKPKRQYFYLLIIYLLLLPFCFLTTSLFLSLKDNIFIIATLNKYWIKIFAVFLLYSLLVFAYIFSFPAVQAPAPSLRILLIIKYHMPMGIKLSDLLEYFNSNEFSQSSVEDLISSKLVRILKNNQLELTCKGLIFLDFFKIYRNILGLDIGKG